LGKEAENKKCQAFIGITTYGGLVHIAEKIGRKDITRLLHETLDEEKACDELLTTIAEGHMNQGTFQKKNQ